jgi:GrpB-like predicted nucleotidyltransferase (UPF0157 family)
LTVTDIQKAIEYIEDCQQIHRLWADWLRANPAESQKPVPRIEVAGNADFHEEWVQKYEHVLRVLRSVESLCPKT